MTTNEDKARDIAEKLYYSCTFECVDKHSFMIGAVVALDSKKREIEALRERVEYWKQVAQDCAVMKTNQEACEHYEKAFIEDGETGK